MKTMQEHKKMNRKGDIPSIIFAIVMIFIIGILIFFFSHVGGELYDALDSSFINESYANTTAETTLTDIRDFQGSQAWDYAFLGVFFGVMLALMLTGYAVRVSAIFYWIYGLVAGIVLILGVILSNTWQSVAANGEFASTIARFPIMNFMLGTYYPTIVTGVVILAMILLFGKQREGSGLQ